MSTTWLGALLTSWAAAVTALRSRGRRREMAELGAVSARWLAEQRSTEPYR